MILPKATAHAPEPRTITMADGQTFTLLVSKPSFEQRFIDEGNEVRAYHGNDPDAWPAYRLGRVKMAIADWQDITDDDKRPIPFTFARLCGLMEAAPEVVTQITAISNEAFRPLVVMPTLPDPPESSGTDATPANQSQQNSPSTSDTSEQNNSPTALESQQQS